MLKFLKENLREIIVGLIVAIVPGLVFYFFGIGGDGINQEQKVSSSPGSVNVQNNGGEVNVGNVRRVLDEQRKKEIVEDLEILGVDSVVIRYASDSETVTFVNEIGKFLVNEGYRLNFVKVMDSQGIEQGEFSIQSHPKVSTSAIIKIGTQ